MRRPASSKRALTLRAGGSLRTTIAASLLTAAIVSCGGREASGGSGEAGGSTRGGTLRILAHGDVDHLLTSSGYLTSTNLLYRTFTRQLVTYPVDSNFAAMTGVVADLITAVPTRANGGVSADGKTYTMHLRRGVKWNTAPARDVTAGDAVRGIKMICNPVSPSGAPGYYELTIVGLTAFCADFAKVKGDAAMIKQYVSTHEVTGVKAPDDSTLIFSLLLPSSDFLDILTLNFASPMPVEYLDYLPDSPDFRTHTISDGPYQLVHYAPGREMAFARNPVWTAESDPLRPAHVDSILLTEGISGESVQQQLEAGTGDLGFNTAVPTADLAPLIAAKDPRLILGPVGPNYTALLGMPINHQSPNERGALQSLKVRQALEYAIDRAALVQLAGGPLVAKPAKQAVADGTAGIEPGFDPYPTPGDHDDPAKAKQLLAEAGYPNGLSLKLLYQQSDVGARYAQTIQASFTRAGIRTELVPATGADLYAKYVGNPENGKRGTWDVAIMGWVPDWFGANNGRGVIESGFDGRNYGPNSGNYGDYSSVETNAWIDKATSALSTEDAMAAWVKAAKQVMADAGVVPLLQTKAPVFRGSRVQHCVFSLQSFSCDIPSLWLSGVSPSKP